MSFVGVVGLLVARPLLAVPVSQTEPSLTASRSISDLSDSRSVSSQRVNIVEPSTWQPEKSLEFEVDDGQPEGTSAEVEVDGGQPEGKSHEVEVGDRQLERKSPEVDFDGGRPEEKSPEIEVDNSQPEEKSPEVKLDHVAIKRMSYVAEDIYMKINIVNGNYVRQ